MKRMVIPSIIANSQKELEERMGKVNSGFYQLDVMDGKFVKNKCSMFHFKLPKNKKYEAHLMIRNPEKWIEKNWMKFDSIAFHLESTKNPDKLIGFIKNKKRKVGVALNPETKINRLKIHLDEIDYVLALMVKPGKYGAKFKPKVIDKIRQLKKLKPGLEIEVDGGVNDKIISKAMKAGASRFVVGSYIQNSENPKKAFAKLKRIVKA
ncbi:MAG: ribulose-phosphate 3-epimerase [Nanoarchaeota archaeon]